MYEIHYDADDSEEAEPVIEVSQTSMWPNLSTQNEARSLRVALGFSVNNLVVSHYVAYVVGTRMILKRKRNKKAGQERY